MKGILSKNKKLYQLLLTEEEAINFYIDYWKTKAKTFINRPVGYRDNSLHTFEDIITILERLNKIQQEVK